MAVIFVFVVLNTVHGLEIVTPKSLKGTYSHATADFGPKPQSYSTPISPLVVTNPPLACEELSNGPELQDAIAVIYRGNCTFVHKAESAAAAGAVGVLIVNYDATLLVMSGSSSINIPVAIITHSVGEAIAGAVNATAILGKAGEERLVWDVSFWDAVISFFVITIPCCFCIAAYLHYNQRRNRRHPDWVQRGEPRDLSFLPLFAFAEVDPNAPAAATATATESAPAESQHSVVVPLQSPIEEKTQRPLEKAVNNECSICLESFKADEQVRFLPCRHIFHKSCIDPWLSTQSNLCPFCKQDAFLLNHS